MSTFRTSLRIVAAHRAYVLVYLVLLSMLGLLTGLARSEGSSHQVKQATASVAVIDRDGSTISQGIKDYIESVGEAKQLEDSTRAIQDAGYGEALQRAARGGGGPPQMDTVIGYESASGALMDVRADSYVGKVADYLSALTDDPARAVALAEETMRHCAPTERIAQDATPLPHSLLVYARFSLYPLLAFAVVAIATLMASLGRRAVRSRLTAAPVGSGTHNLGVLGACLVVGAIGWLWVFGLGVAVFGMSALAASAPLLGVVGAALGAYTLVAVSLGFLIGQIGMGENAANAIANIGGMALSFLGGTWVPIEWLPDAVARAARLTPGYWVDQALSGAYAATSTSAEALLPLLADCGICALFALALLSVAMGVRRTRARASL